MLLIIIIIATAIASFFIGLFIGAGTALDIIQADREKESEFFYFEKEDGKPKEEKGTILLRKL